jgi:hypothetical protein
VQFADSDFALGADVASCSHISSYINAWNRESLSSRIGDRLDHG